MTSRRSFLQVLGAAPVAIPLAAKAAADQAMGQLAGVASSGMGSGSIQGSAIGGPIGLGSGDTYKKLLDLVARNALPDWYEDQLRERYGHVAILDPDIANKRTWSMSVKIATQRQRNIARGRADLTKSAERQMNQSDFYTKFGIWL